MKISKEDITIINEALEAGNDVCIQNTPDGGCRIVSHKVKVLKRAAKPERSKPRHLGLADQRN